MKKLSILTVSIIPYTSTMQGSSSCAGGGSCQSCGGGHCGSCGGGKCSGYIDDNQSKSE